MAPKYTLHYFNLRARGEVIRWLFSYGEQEFEDHRIEFSEWTALRASTPFGTVPYLEIDGKLLNGSMTIARFLARKYGLAGQDAFEEAQADAIVDYREDAAKDYVKWIQAFRFKHENEPELREKYLTVTVLPYLHGLEQQLRNNPKGSNYFVGDKATWADMVIAHFLDSLVNIGPNILDKYPLLQAHNVRVHEMKGVREWIAKRPASAF